MVGLPSPGTTDGDGDSVGGMLRSRPFLSFIPFVAFSVDGAIELVTSGGADGYDDVVGALVLLPLLVAFSIDGAFELGISEGTDGEDDVVGVSVLLPTMLAFSPLAAFSADGEIELATSGGADGGDDEVGVLLLLTTLFFFPPLAAFSVDGAGESSSPGGADGDDDVVGSMVALLSLWFFSGDRPFAFLAERAFSAFLTAPSAAVRLGNPNVPFSSRLFIVLTSAIASGRFSPLSAAWVTPKVAKKKINNFTMVILF